MTGGTDDPARTYPRLHVEMRRLSDTAVLVDGWLIENAKGKGRTVLRCCVNMSDTREQISNCASKYNARCDDRDIVIHETVAKPATED
jgi:hypothetical protein